ncbi:MAG: hypothetical protein AAFY08_12800 [Planctomycetota bacterium]
MGKNIAIIILALVLMLSLAGNVMLGAALWVTGQLAVANINAGFGGLVGFSISETYPAQVNNGDSFVITVDVTNTLTTPIEVYEIDLNTPLLDGFRVDSVTPTPTAINDYYSLAGYVEYMLSHSIPAGQTQTFTFNCTAIQAGMWSGSIDVYDPGLAVESRVITIDVR